MKNNLWFLGIVVWAVGIGMVSVAGAEPNDPKIPVLTCTDFNEPFDPAYLSNGVIGVRPASFAFYAARPTLVSGFVKDWQWEAVECIADAPYPFETNIVIGGENLRDHLDRTKIISQSLNMACGELTTELQYQKDDATINITILQFLPRTLPSAACQKIEIGATAPIDVEIIPQVKQGLHKYRNKLGVALVDGETRKFSLQPEQPVTYLTVCAMVSEFYHPEPDLQAKRAAGWAKMVGFDTLREQNRKAWQELWKGRIKITGDAEAQTVIDSAFFYVMSSASPFCMTGIGPYCLSSMDFAGHSFWDTDHWVFHAILPIAPSAARALMDYRFRGLEMARRKAATFGFEGAMFPWEGGQLDGAEATPTSASTGWAEHHVMPGVALAFWEFYLATGDEEFLKQRAWPVLKSVAQWIESRGTFTARGFEILNVMGFDEAISNINNNAHMNLLCQMALKAATRAAERLSLPVSSTWRRIADRMYLPIDPEKNTVMAYDHVVVAPQAKGYSLGSVQMLVFHDPPVDRELFRRTFDYEETLRTIMDPASNCPCSDKSVGFPCPPFATSAALLGYRDKAAELFRASWEKHTLRPYRTSKEYPFSSAGNFITNQGSQLQAVIYGFTGLRLGEGDWRKYSASLPAGWERIQIDRMWIKGKPYKLIAEHGKKAQLIPLAE